MAEEVGFEPTEGFHLRRFSRPTLNRRNSLKNKALVTVLYKTIWQCRRYNLLILLVQVCGFYTDLRGVTLVVFGVHNASWCC
jgi:hypothetical protein